MYHKVYYCPEQIAIEMGFDGLIWLIIYDQMSCFLSVEGLPGLWLNQIGILIRRGSGLFSLHIPDQ
jgi:hypothetical protein